MRKVNAKINAKLGRGVNGVAAKSYKGWFEDGKSAAEAAAEALNEERNRTLE